ncbi:hypothetical protein E3N88_27836 [Mikania micrantha]|uniref:BHLH domain-containing protein n=1 Tax=Mikania micrantha TaxID=192012 RepID=A0A5N6N0M2_9ASTR|nr:hypothetical protein E3N88_27836 [Mikania micrantha]
MGEEAGQERLFWDTSDQRVMAGSSGEGGSKERSPSDKNLSDLSTRKNDNQTMKHRETARNMDGSSAGDQEVAVTGVGMKKDDAFEIKNTRGSSLDNDPKEKREVEPSDHELHIRTERERRKKMRNMFHQLHALMPQLPQKADKTAVVNEAIRYIKTLQLTIQRLETKKLERLYGSSTETITASLIQPQRLLINTRESFIADQGSPTGNINGKASPSRSTSLSFPLCSPKVFQTWVSSNVTLNVCGLDALISVCSSCKHGLLTAICFMLEKHKLEIVSAQISSNESKSLFMIHVQANTCDEFMETFHVDEIYKLAASEIAHWLNSKTSS